MAAEEEEVVEVEAKRPHETFCTTASSTQRILAIQMHT